ncbi:tetratricopeptide repeat protein [Sphingomonas sp.]|uniref:tetratricopeptide repeat protein n=1 Tax=Sphingomonas sp. TaxID=28214 RepID=UPI001B23C28D|nr:tetratricopeptide repeat protein [Sphingomonas sp.]MBO9714973.1 hypothetical protein [Sphingomonas sp.]
MKFQRKWRGALALAAGAAAALPAHAEVIEITGEFPAPSREASLLTSLHVAPISGQDGPALEIAIERALANGVPFALVAGRAGRQGAEGTLSGTVSTGVEESRYTRKDKHCVQKDANNKKCVKEEEVEVPCKRRVVNVNADLRIVRETDGRIVYSRGFPIRDEITWCQKENPPRTVEESVSNAIGNIAGSIRYDVAPRVETYRIRLRETNKGMDKPTAQQFKALIKSSQRDMRGACQAWTAMDQATPGNGSLLYNLGLCAEQRGDYEGAIALYRRAVAAGAREGSDGANRATQLIAGRDDARERAKRR